MKGDVKSYLIGQVIFSCIQTLCIVILIFYTWQTKMNSTSIVKAVVQPIAVLGGAIYSIIMMLVIGTREDEALAIWFYAWAFMQILAMITWLIHNAQVKLCKEKSPNTIVQHVSHATDTLSGYGTNHKVEHADSDIGFANNQDSVSDPKMAVQDGQNEAGEFVYASDKHRAYSDP